MPDEGPDSTQRGRSPPSIRSTGYAPKTVIAGRPWKLREAHSLGPAHVTAGSRRNGTRFRSAPYRTASSSARQLRARTHQPSGAPIYSLVFSRPPSCLAVSTAGDARRSRFAVARDIRTDHPGLATTRRVRSQFGWYLIWISATKRDHRDADRQIRYRRYGSSPKARPTIPLFS